MEKEACWRRKRCERGGMSEAAERPEAQLSFPHQIHTHRLTHRKWGGRRGRWRRERRRRERRAPLLLLFKTSEIFKVSV
jgi:hypothetical protein